MLPNKELDWCLQGFVQQELPVLAGNNAALHPKRRKVDM